MNEDRYKVYIDDEVVAENMDIETANILIKALWSTYYNDPTMTIKIEKMTKSNDCDSAAKVSSSPVASAAEEIYPLIIVKDRYNGAYSGGNYTAWHSFNVPDGIFSDSITCLEFWKNKPPYCEVGVGDTIEDAINDLAHYIEMNNELKEKMI